MQAKRTHTLKTYQHTFYVRLQAKIGTRRFPNVRVVEEIQENHTCSLWTFGGTWTIIHWTKYPSWTSVCCEHSHVDPTYLLEPYEPFYPTFWGEVSQLETYLILSIFHFIIFCTFTLIIYFVIYKSNIYVLFVILYFDHANNQVT